MLLSKRFRDIYDQQNNVFDVSDDNNDDNDGLGNQNFRQMNIINMSDVGSFLRAKKDGDTKKKSVSRSISPKPTVIYPEILIDSECDPTDHSTDFFT